MHRLRWGCMYRSWTPTSCSVRGVHGTSMRRTGTSSAARTWQNAHQISSTANNGFMSEAADTKTRTVSYGWGVFGTKPSDVAALREIGGVDGLLPGHRTTMAGTLRKHSGHSHSTLTSSRWRVGVGMMPVWIAVRSWRPALTSCPLPLSFPLNPFPP